MAQKKKNKKKAQVVPVKPQKYLQEAARKIPLDKVFSDYDNNTGGVVQIIVTRKRLNGTYLIGMYLIDMFCLGLKSTNFRQTMDEYELETFIKEFQRGSGMLFSEIEPNLAFNIIYGGIEYAEDLGFDVMDKDFEFTEYILPPVESIEYIDIEFGHDGKPFYISGPYDNVAKNIAILNKNVGVGNYHYVANVGGTSGHYGDEDDDHDDDTIEHSPMIGLVLDFEDDDLDLRHDAMLMAKPEISKATVSMGDIVFDEVDDFDAGISDILTHILEGYYDKTSHINLHLTISGDGNLEKHKPKLLKSFFKMDEDDEDISIDYEFRYPTFLPHFSTIKDFTFLNNLIQGSVMLQYMDTLLSHLHGHYISDTYTVAPFIKYGDKDDYNETTDHISIGITIDKR